MPPNESRRVRRVGQEAVEAVLHDAPDLVLDVDMRVMNGLEALRHIRELDLTGGA